MLILFVKSYAQKSDYNMASKWYQLYGQISVEHKLNSTLKCTEPSLAYANLNRQAVDNNEMQLLYFNYELTPKQQNLFSPFAEYGNIQMTGSSISGLSLFGPLDKLVDDNCMVTINVPQNPIVACDQIDVLNLGNFLGENNIYKYFQTVTITHMGVNITPPMVPGDKAQINYWDLYGKNLELNVVYDANHKRTFRFRFDASDYDWTKCGTPPEIEPIHPDDWPPVSDPDPTDPDPINIVCCYVPPPPVFDPNCLYTPDEQWVVRAEIPYSNHPINNLNTLAEENDFLKYSTTANPGVDEGRNSYSVDLEPGPDTFNGIIDAAVYINPERQTILRPVILTDGIDFFSNRSSKEMLQAFGGNAILQKFFDGGYDVIVADFRGGADFMQKNAFALIQLIKKLNDDGVEQIPAVIGPSMGGQIIRYALLYWENNLMNSYGDHKIVNFLSADSPWVGANASPAIQAVSRMGGNFLEELLTIDVMANTPAARQLLIHQTHGLNVANFSYDGVSHPYKADFDSEIQSMGEYPKSLKVISIADGGNGGSSNYQGGNYATGGTSILDFHVDQHVPILPDVNGDFHFNAIQDGSHLVNYEGNWPDRVAERSGIENIVTNSSSIQNLDSAPGSPFRIEDLINGLSNSDLIVNSSFTFVPTFSALGINTTDAKIDVEDPSNESPYFDDYFVDDTDSGHNDISQAGSLEFFLDYINYVDGQSKDACTFLEEAILQGESPYISDDPIEVFVSYLYMEHMDQFFGSSITSDFCKKDLRLFSAANEFVGASPNFNIIDDPCGLEPEWDFQSNTVDTNEDPAVNGVQCTVIAEICHEHPLCPDVDIPCKEVIIHYNIELDYQSPLRGVLTEQSLLPVSDSLTTEKESNNRFEIYPNPTNSDIRIFLNEGENIISIYSVSGSLLKEVSTFHEVYDISLNSGTYLIRVFNLDTQKIDTEKVIAF